MRFWLGTHRPYWLWDMTMPPLFVSHNTLKPYRKLKPATGVWALDSGGFTELSQHGTWRTGPEPYIEAVQRYSAEIGGLEWAAPQDWMCEPFITAKTGLTVREHQERTVQNFLDIQGHGPFIPVLQGWTITDYHECVELYEQAGVDLRALPLVGVGSVCRRQSTQEIGVIMRDLDQHGVRVHGFGVKKEGIVRYGQHLASADSMAWSFQGRRMRLDGCTHPARNCANCAAWALTWRQGVMRAIDSAGHTMDQLSLEMAA